MKTPSPKLRVYETLHAINQGFEQVLIDLGRLDRLGFRDDFVGSCRVIVEETRAWANFEVVEALERREQSDWERFSRLRRESEQKLEDPNDLLLKAERLQQSGRSTKTRKGRR
jgi:hypothetical protein